MPDVRLVVSMCYYSYLRAYTHICEYGFVLILTNTVYVKFVLALKRCSHTFQGHELFSSCAILYYITLVRI